MISTVDYIKFKKRLQKEYRGAKVHIEFKGIIDTKIIIDKAKIIINPHKLVIANDEQDFSMEFLLVKKIKFEDMFYIEIIYQDFKIILTV